MMGEELEEVIFNFSLDNVDLKLEGKKPESGKMIINEEGKVAIGITDGNFCAIKGYDDEEITITEDPELPNVLAQIATTSEELGVDSVYDCVRSGICPVATPFAPKVNDTETYKFYVISDDGNEITLIMASNLGELVAWNSSRIISEGPLTIVNKLDELTDEEWTNIPVREYTYSDDGGGNQYSAFKRKMRGRLLTYTEATALGCTTQATCPIWLDDQIWTSAAIAASSEVVTIYQSSIRRASPIHTRYLRPVITIAK